MSKLYLLTATHQVQQCLRAEQTIHSNCHVQCQTRVKFYSLLSRDTKQCFLFYVTLDILLQQAIGGQHGDAGLSTEESHDTTQTQQLVIPVQEQNPHLQPAFCGPGTGGIFHHVGEEGAARPWYHCGLHQLPYQREDDNQASGWSRRFAGIRQGGSQTTRREGCQVSNRLNTPVEEEGQYHGYDCGSGLQNRVTSIQQKERVTEHYCGTQELQQLSNETHRRRVVYHGEMNH